MVKQTSKRHYKEPHMEMKGFSTETNGFNIPFFHNSDLYTEYLSQESLFHNKFLMQPAVIFCFPADIKGHQ